MRTTMLVCVAVVLAMLAFPSSPGGASADPSRVDILPFGTLIRGAACEAATHTIVSPCFPYTPRFFAVFKKNEDVTPLEGHNVKIRGMVDETSCSLPLFRVIRIAESNVLPPCPEPCPPGDPFCLQP